eukprot:EG_transcript_20461
MLPIPPLPIHCLACSQPNPTNFCTACAYVDAVGKKHGTAFYCNAACQKQHWRSHKPKCVPVAQQTGVEVVAVCAAQRTQLRARRAVYLRLFQTTFEPHDVDQLVLQWGRFSVPERRVALAAIWTELKHFHEADFPLMVFCMGPKTVDAELAAADGEWLQQLLQQNTAGRGGPDAAEFASLIAGHAGGLWPELAGHPAHRELEAQLLADWRKYFVASMAIFALQGVVRAMPEGALLAPPTLTPEALAALVGLGAVSEPCQVPRLEA